jgi:hypothetical protein
VRVEGGDHVRGEVFDPKSVMRRSLIAMPFKGQTMEIEIIREMIGEFFELILRTKRTVQE